MDLQQHMAANGFDLPPAHLTPGKWCRFPGIGKRKGNTAGWAIQSESGLVNYGCLACDEQFTWVPENCRPLSRSDREALRRRVEAEKAKAASEMQARQKRAASGCVSLWNAAPYASGQHGYLQTKGIRPNGAALIESGDYAGALMVPIIGTEPPYENQIQSVQFIFADGQKKFYPGAKLSAGYFPVQIVPGQPIVICEGFATGATLAEQYAPNSTVICTLVANNLMAVASFFRRLAPNAPITIAGDEDRYQTCRQCGQKTDVNVDAEVCQCCGKPHGKKNHGREKAIQAAQAVNGSVSIPSFSDCETGSDWNDRYLLNLWSNSLCQTT